MTTCLLEKFLKEAKFIAKAELFRCVESYDWADLCLRLLHLTIANHAEVLGY